MFGDDYIRKIGLATEKEAKVALYKFVFAQYGKSNLGAAGGDESDEDVAVKLAVAVTNRVFGEDAANDGAKQFAAENADLISAFARKLSTDENLCLLLSGAAYNTCYARYVRAGGSRAPFSNAFLVYVRTLSRDESYAATRAKVVDRIARLGAGILRPIESMLSLGIFRPLPDNPNERSFYEAVRQFATVVDNSAVEALPLQKETVAEAADADATNGPKPQTTSACSGQRPEGRVDPARWNFNQVDDDLMADSATDPLTVQLRREVENLPSIPGPKTVGSENYSQIVDAFTKRGWAGFEEAFDRIVPRSRADYVEVKRDLLREPVFSLKFQRNMLRLAKVRASGSTAAEQERAVTEELKRIEAERAAINVPIVPPERMNSASHIQAVGGAHKTGNEPKSGALDQQLARNRADHAAAAQSIATAQFHYQPRRGNIPGYVLMDVQTRGLLNSILADTGISVTVVPGKVPALVDALRTMEENVKPYSEAAAAKVAQLRQTVTTAFQEHALGGVAFAIDEPSIRAEMQIYVTQTEIGGGKILQSADYKQLSQEPEMRIFTAHLERAGYDSSQPQLMALTAATHIMVGVEGVGGTAPQRSSFLEK